MPKSYFGPSWNHPRPHKKKPLQVSAKMILPASSWLEICSRSTSVIRKCIPRLNSGLSKTPSEYILLPRGRQSFSSLVQGSALEVLTNNTYGGFCEDDFRDCWRQWYSEAQDFAPTRRCIGANIVLSRNCPITAGTILECYWGSSSSKRCWRRCISTSLQKPCASLYRWRQQLMTSSLQKPSTYYIQVAKRGRQRGGNDLLPSRKTFRHCDLRMNVAPAKRRRR